MGYKNRQSCRLDKIERKNPKNFERVTYFPWEFRFLSHRSINLWSITKCKSISSFKMLELFLLKIHY